MNTHSILTEKGYKLERSGGVWQYRRQDSFYSLGLNNSYKENEVIEFIKGRCYNEKSNNKKC